jgi:hypothetical protein
MIISIDVYEHVRKSGTSFHSLRAVGLAIELAHKIARDKGFGKVAASDLATVNISGSGLQACIDNTWRKVAQGNIVKLQLLATDRKLALSVFQKQRAHIADLGLNIWHVDVKMGNGIVSPDLIVDAGPTAHGDMSGLISVELKLCSEKGLDDKTKQFKNDFQINFLKVQCARKEISQGILFISIVKWDRSSWISQGIETFLWKQHKWENMCHSISPSGAGGGKMTKKKPLPDVFNAMSWYDSPKGNDKLGLVSHFLQALGLNHNNVKERVCVWKAAMKAKNGEKFALLHCQIHKGGPKCWAGTQTAFRAVYHYL